MLENFVQKVKGFFLKPVESFKDSVDDSFGDAFAYYIILLVIYSVLAGIVGGAIDTALLSPFLGTYLPLIGTTDIAMLIITSIFFFVIFGLIAPVWLHVWVYLLGGRKGILQTYKTFCYAITPFFLIGWLPLINIITIIWTFVLSILGIRELHEISTIRAAIAAIIALLFPVIISLVLFVGYFTVATSSVTPVAF